jgi:hypothetical protein
MPGPPYRRRRQGEIECGSRPEAPLLLFFFGCHPLDQVAEDSAHTEDTETREDTDTPPATWRSVSIGFDDDSGVVDNRYADDVLFSSDAGYEVYAYSPGISNLDEPMICTGRSGVSCQESLFLDFAAPARSVRFLATVVNDADERAATVRVHTEDGEEDEITFTRLEASTAAFEHVEVDLSAFENVIRVEVVDIEDGYGVGYDNFRFELRE